MPRELPDPILSVGVLDSLKYVSDIVSTDFGSPQNSIGGLNFLDSRIPNHMKRVLLLGTALELYDYLGQLVNLESCSCIFIEFILFRR